MSFLCNKVKFDRVSVVLYRRITYLSPVKLHYRSCETSFQTLIDGNLGNRFPECFDFDHRVSMKTVVSASRPALSELWLPQVHHVNSFCVIVNGLNPRSISISYSVNCCW